MSRTKQILGHASLYSAASVLTQLISVVVAILMRRFLGPLQTGIWSLVQIVLVYAEYATLGIIQVIPRDIPFYNGKGEARKAERIKDLSFSFTAIASIVVAAGLIAACFLFRSFWREEVFYALLAGAGLVILQRFNDLLISLLRAYKDFELASKQMVLSAVVNGVLVAVLSHYFRLYGFLWGMALSFFFNIGFILFHRSFRFRFVWNADEARKLVAEGLPLMTLSFFTTLFMTADKIVISKFLGLEPLGLYSIAVMTSSYIYSFPNAIGIVMIPSVLEKYGRREEMQDLSRYLLESNRVYGALMPVLIAFAWFGMPLAVEWLLPKFTEGLGAMKNLALGAFFLAAGQSYNHFLFAVKKNASLLGIVAGLAALAAIADLAAIRAGAGLGGVALATTGAMLAYFSLLFWRAAPHVWPVKECTLEYARMILGFLFMLGLLLALERLPITGPSGKALCQMTIFTAVYLPWLFGIYKRLMK